MSILVSQSPRWHLQMSVQTPKIFSIQWEKQQILTLENKRQLINYQNTLISCLSTSALYHIYFCSGMLLQYNLAFSLYGWGKEARHQKVSRWKTYEWVVSTTTWAMVPYKYKHSADCIWSWLTGWDSITVWASPSSQVVWQIRSYSYRNAPCVTVHFTICW